METGPNFGLGFYYIAFYLSDSALYLVSEDLSFKICTHISVANRSCQFDQSLDTFWILSRSLRSYTTISPTRLSFFDVIWMNAFLWVHLRECEKCVGIHLYSNKWINRGGNRDGVPYTHTHTYIDTYICYICYICYVWCHRPSNLGL